MQNLQPYNTSTSAPTIVETTQYSPFGERLNNSVIKFGYEGKEADTLVGDTDFNFRKYKPTWGMFTQPDSETTNVYDPQQLNSYSFERNNAYRYTDPDGHRITYGVEDAGPDRILAIYADGQYQGRVVNEVATTTTYKTQWGTDISVTSYDYDVQLGSRSNAQGTMTGSSYDCTNCGTMRLSDIYYANQKKLTKDENFDKAAGVSTDTIGVLSSISSGGTLKPALDTASWTSAGLSSLSYASGRSTFTQLLLSFVPGYATYQAFTDKSGYTPSSQITAYGSVRGGAGGRSSITGGGTFHPGAPSLHQGSGGYYGGGSKSGSSKK